MFATLIMSALSQEQVKAFTEASGAGITPNEAQDTFALIFAVLLLVWWAWVISSQYRLFVSEKENLAAVGYNVLRSSLIVMFSFFVLYMMKPS